MLGAWFRDETICFSSSNKCMADPKAYKLEISGPGPRFVVIYMRPVRTQTGVTISRLGPATERRSDRSEFIVRSVSCKRIKRNVWRPGRTHGGLSLSRSHVNTPLLHVSKIPIS